MSPYFLQKVNDKLLEILDFGLELSIAQNSFNVEACHIRCLGHVIHLAVTGATAVVRDQFIKLRDFVKKVRSSNLKTAAFAEACNSNNLKPLKLIMDVVTRWSSTHAMLARCLELKKAVIALTRKGNSKLFDKDLAEYQLTQDEWKQVEEVHEFLGLFATVTTLI